MLEAWLIATFLLCFFNHGAELSGSCLKGGGSLTGELELGSAEKGAAWLSLEDGF